MGYKNKFITRKMGYQLRTHILNIVEQNYYDKSKKGQYFILIISIY